VVRGIQPERSISLGPAIGSGLRKRPLEQDPEKRVAVFRKDHAQTTT
jgi:hypothetical protein